MDECVSYGELEGLTQEYLDIYNRAPPRLKIKGGSFASMRASSSTHAHPQPLPPLDSIPYGGSQLQPPPTQRGRSRSPSPKRYTHSPLVVIKGFFFTNFPLGFLVHRARVMVGKEGGHSGAISNMGQPHPKPHPPQGGGPPPPHHSSKPPGKEPINFLFYGGFEALINPLQGLLYVFLSRYCF